MSSLKDKKIKNSMPPIKFSENLKKGKITQALKASDKNVPLKEKRTISDKN
jgi:hypothetical protein